MLRLFLSCMVCLLCTTIQSQENNVFWTTLSIRADGLEADTSSLLDIQSTTKGVLIPRMTTNQRTAIAGGNPAEALLVYDSDTGSFWFYDGSNWQELNYSGSWDYYYMDNDGDSYGNAMTAVYTNDPLSDYVTNDADCDDTNSAINPAGTEICDEIDNDCDGMTDEGVTTTYYLDSDGDGYGEASSTTQACNAPSGYVADNTDCDDTDPTIYPGAPEICDGQVNDCGGSLPANEIDDDADTYVECDIHAGGWDGAGGVAGGGDCNDSDSNVYPGATETCNGADDDCNGIQDDNLTPPLNPNQNGVCNGSLQTCAGPSGWVEDYSGIAAYEDPEVTCDGLDNDCDGQVDENCDSCGNSCDDGLDCTTDICNSGSCEYSIDSGACVIDGVCYMDGDPNPASECQECDSATSQTSWTNLADGTMCDGGGGECNNGACVPL